MNNKIFKIWTKFDSYTGNFEREFVAYMMGYEKEDDESFYFRYTSDFEENATSLHNLRRCLMFTNQEVDDWSEATCYNIDHFPTNEGPHNCNGIFIQFTRKPTQEEFEAFKLRAKGFPTFFNAVEEYKNQMKVEDFGVYVEQTTNEKIL